MGKSKVTNRISTSLHDLMQRPWRATRILVTSVVGLLLFISVAQAASDLIVWERGDQIVQLGKQDDVSATPNDHPVSITADKIETILNTLRLRYANEDSAAAPVSVFTPEEIDNLGKAVATALGRAAPSQDVYFHVIGVHQLSRGAFARRNRVSAGRVFYRGGNLNIIFGQVQTPHRKKNIYGQTDQDFYPRNYGNRSKAAKHDVVFIPDSATRLYRDNSGTRDDWIVIEPGAAVVEVPIRPLLPAARSSVDEAKEPGGGTGAQSMEMTADVEERLEALKRLLERELISEDAYQAKMKEILQDL